MPDYEVEKKIFREPVEFENNGNRLYGMIHHPSSKDSTKPGVVLLSSGLKNRIGYGRLYVSLADFLAGHGYPVMRYDYHGCGDSDGHLSLTNLYHEMHADINGFIQTGLFANDTIKAIDLMKKKTNSKKFVTCGFCGGSNTSLYTSIKSEDIITIILGNLPVALDSTLVREQNKDKIDIWSLNFNYTSYLKKLTQLKAWLRFLSFKSDYKYIFKIYLTKFRQICSKHTTNSNNIEPVGKKFIFNHDLLEKLSFYFDSGRNAYFLFAENDQITVDYETYFEPNYGKKILEKYKNQWEKTVFKDSNHSYTNIEWRNQLFDKILTCINKETEILNVSDD